MTLYYCSVIFFFKQKTAYEMRISDWSSDVCSSDLQVRRRGGAEDGGVGGDRRHAETILDGLPGVRAAACVGAGYHARLRADLGDVGDGIGVLLRERPAAERVAHADGEVGRAHLDAVDPGSGQHVGVVLHSLHSPDHTETGRA